MNNQKNDKNQIIEDMKSCVQGMNLPILDETNKDGVLGIYSEVEFDFFSIHIFTYLPVDQDIIKINTVFAPSIHQDNLDKIRDLLNRLNTQLMDIGTLTVCNGGVVSFRTAMPLTIDNFGVDQFRESLNRLIMQGKGIYGLILSADLDDASPEEILREFFECVKAYKGNPDGGNPIMNQTIH